MTYNMAMKQYSDENIPYQIDYLTKVGPYIRQVHLINNDTINKTDYIYGVDAIGVKTAGDTVKIQFKRRRNGDDITIPVDLLHNADRKYNGFGFWYEGEMYTFLLTADIYVVTDSQRNHYIYTADEMNTAELLWGDTLHKALTIRPLKNGKYIAYMSANNLRKLQQRVFELRCPASA